MTEKEKMQLEMLENGEIFLYQIENPTEEMLWYGVKHNCILTGQKLTPEMVEYLVKEGKIPPVTNSLKDYNISEEAWIEGIKNTKPQKAFLNKFFQTVIQEANMTCKIAFALCMADLSLYQREDVKKILQNDKDKLAISERFFEIEKDVSSGCFNATLLPADIPISEENWRWMLDTGYLYCVDHTEHYIKNRNDVPEFVKLEYLKTQENLDGYGPLTKDEFVYWLNQHKTEIDSRTCKDSIKNVKCDDMEGVMLECGWFIKYWRSQSAKLCNAAIKCDPFNIQYIKKPTDAMKTLALSLNKDIKKVLDEKTENPYPEKNYLVKLNANVCDESNIIKVFIAPGSEMERIMSATTHVSFGNMDDPYEYDLKDIAAYYPITDEEIETLKKFGLDYLKSGYFSGI